MDEQTYAAWTKWAVEYGNVLTAEPSEAFEAGYDTGRARRNSVWILYWTDGNTPSSNQSIDGVYSSLEQAKQACRATDWEQNRWGQWGASIGDPWKGKYDAYWIEEHDVDPVPAEAPTA